MKSVRVHSGRAVPLPRSDVDTDQIIPSDWLKQVERTGFGKGLFSEWRDDRAFVLNDERFAGATVLVAGPNFGTGSSREHAVWAIQDYGFEAVISARFADIFRNNCTKNGLVPAQLHVEVVEQILVAVQDDASIEVVVDVERLVVEVPALGIVAPFPLDPSTQHRFLHGLDDIGITLEVEHAIAEYEAHRPAYLPSLSPTGG
jgi:3-isopropylmalate/(R)-2-methylmalate dehydratase small subunit